MKQMAPRKSHWPLHPLIFTPFTFLLVSCDMTPINGALDGRWQLTSIETPATIRKTKDNLVFLSIQLRIAQWDDFTHNRRYYSHFTHQGDSLFFFEFVHPAAHSVNDNTNKPISADDLSLGLMDAWGIHTFDTRYRVQTLTHSSLILEKADTVLCFRKF